jgi:chaperonin cofactor prefoldin
MNEIDKVIDDLQERLACLELEKYQIQYDLNMLRNKVKKVEKVKVSEDSKFNVGDCIYFSAKSNTIFNTPGKIVRFTKKCVWVEDEDGKEWRRLQRNIKSRK